MYNSNDSPWVPYPEVFARFGWVTDEPGLPAVLRAVHAMTVQELENRTRLVLAARASHFSYEGTLEQVSRFMLAQPSRPSDLRCVALPLSPSGH